MNVSNPSQIDSQPPTPQFTFNGVSGGTTLTGKVSISLNVVAANPTDIARVEFALLTFGGQVAYSATDTSAPFCLVPDCTAWDSASIPSGVYTIQAISYDKRSAAAGGPRTTYRSAGIYIDNPEPISVEFSAANYSVSEGVAKATATVELSDPASQPVTVAYTLGGGSATPGGDYAPASETLTFDPGQTSKTFEIAIADDATPEPAETLNLTLSNPSNAGLGSRDTATLTINDDDQSIISVSASDASAAEADLAGSTITITRSGNPASALTVFYSVAGSATAGVDFSTLPGSVTIPAGQSSATITIAPLDDAAVEGDETVIVALLPQAGYVIEEPSSASMLIADDDSPTAPGPEPVPQPQPAPQHTIYLPGIVR